MLSELIGKEDYASLKRRAQDRNHWRNWIMKNDGQEPDKISRAHKKRRRLLIIEVHSAHRLVRPEPLPILYTVSIEGNIPQRP